MPPFKDEHVLVSAVLGFSVVGEVFLGWFADWGCVVLSRLDNFAGFAGDPGAIGSA